MDPRSLLAAVALLMTVATPLPAQELVATTTNFQITGGVSLMDLAAPFTTDNDKYVVHSDAVIRRWDRYVFVLNRYPLDNVLVLDAGNAYAVVKQYNLAGGCNVQDLVVLDAGKAYVTCYESTELQIIDPLVGTSLGAIDLADFADADGLPEMASLARVGDLVFVALQRLDRPNGYVPSGISMVAVIDGATDTVLDASSEPGLNAITLQTTNPFWRMWLEPGLSRLLVVCSGDFLSADAGLEVINPFSLQSEGTLITEAALGGDLLDVQIVSPTLGYALVGEPDFDTCLKQFDPSTRSVIATVECSSGFQFTDLELASTGLLYVGDRTPSASGVRVFDTASNLEVTASPVNLGLPPFDFVLVEHAVTAVDAPTPAGSRRLLAWPNPFNPRVTLRFGDGSATAGPLLVYDARGRQVARLWPDDRNTYVWTGRTDDGTAAASGVYTARAADGRGPTARLVLVR